MKNLITAFKNGKLTPKERVLLIVHNQIKEETTGKSMLTEAEIHALGQSWTPKDNLEVGEYNRYINGWKTAGFAELDAQTTYLNTHLAFQQEKMFNVNLEIYPMYRDAKRWLKRLGDIKPVTIDEANQIVKRQKQVKLKEGQEYDRAVYDLTIETLDKATREDLELLDGDFGTDPQYLNDEEYLADLFKGKTELTNKDKDELADRIADRAYNKFAKAWQFYHYFGSISIREIARRWFKSKGIKPDDVKDEILKQMVADLSQELKMTEREVIEGEFAESLAEVMEEYAKRKNSTVGDELKQTVREWLDNGLIDEYEPMFKSKNHKTYSGDTKQPHGQLFSKWIEAKTKAKETIGRLIKDGKLKRNGDTITGESLYNLKGYKFADEYREYVDRYDANLGIVYEDGDTERKNHLDRELLVCDKDERGRVLPLSIFQMSKDYLDSFLKPLSYLKESYQNGEITLSFKDKEVSRYIQKTTEKIIKGYATLLAFKEVFDRLSKTYKIDLSYKIGQWIGEVDKFIDFHNKAIETATKAKTSPLSKLGKKMKLRDITLINKDAIKPDMERVGEYVKEFEQILEGDF